MNEKPDVEVGAPPKKVSISSVLLLATFLKLKEKFECIPDSDNNAN